MTFREALAEQRWDDHRFYHHNRINQSLHFVSALCFICSYGLLFVEPAAAILIAWLVAMPSRQLGHSTRCSSTSAPRARRSRC